MQSQYDMYRWGRDKEWREDPVRDGNKVGTMMARKGEIHGHEGGREGGREGGIELTLMCGPGQLSPKVGEQQSPTSFTLQRRECKGYTLQSPPPFEDIFLQAPNVAGVFVILGNHTHAHTHSHRNAHTNTQMPTRTHAHTLLRGQLKHQPTLIGPALRGVWSARESPGYDCSQ